jgi:hypothetical protein
VTSRIEKEINQRSKELSMFTKLNQVSKQQRRWAVFTLGVFLLTLFALPLAFTQAQNKTAEKKLAVEDMFVRESRGAIRAKPGFELVKTGANAIAIRSLSKQTVHATGGCAGECARGVKCAAETNGLRATCCSGDNPMGDCIITFTAR